MKLCQIHLELFKIKPDGGDILMRRIVLIILIATIVFSGIYIVARSNEPKSLGSQLTKFFGSKGYLVVVQKDINRDRLEETIAIKKSEHDKDGILKGIVLQNNNGEYQTLLEITLQGVWGKNKKVILSPEDFVSDISSWKLAPYETSQSTGIKLALIKNNGYTTEYIFIKWDEKQHEYLLVTF